MDESIKGKGRMPVVREKSPASEEKIPVDKEMLLKTQQGENFHKRMLLEVDEASCKSYVLRRDGENSSADFLLVLDESGAVVYGEAQGDNANNKSMFDEIERLYHDKGENTALAHSAGMEKSSANTTDLPTTANVHDDIGRNFFHSSLNRLLRISSQFPSNQRYKDAIINFISSDKNKVFLPEYERKLRSEKTSEANQYLEILSECQKENLSKEEMREYLGVYLSPDSTMVDAAREWLLEEIPQRKKVTDALESELKGEELSAFQALKKEASQETRSEGIRQGAENEQDPERNNFTKELDRDLGILIDNKGDSESGKASEALMRVIGKLIGESKHFIDSAQFTLSDEKFNELNEARGIVGISKVSRQNTSSVRGAESFSDEAPVTVSHNKRGLTFGKGPFGEGPSNQR